LTDFHWLNSIQQDAIYIIMNILERRFMRQTYKITFFSVELYPPSPTPVMKIWQIILKLFHVCFVFYHSKTFCCHRHISPFGREMLFGLASHLWLLKIIKVPKWSLGTPEETTNQSDCCPSKTTLVVYGVSIYLSNLYVKAYLHTVHKRQDKCRLFQKVEHDLVTIKREPGFTFFLKNKCLDV
jgi:hypothetical protein